MGRDAGFVGRSMRSAVVALGVSLLAFACSMMVTVGPLATPHASATTTTITFRCDGIFGNIGVPLVLGRAPARLQRHFPPLRCPGRPRRGGRRPRRRGQRHARGHAGRAARDKRRRNAQGAVFDSSGGYDAGGGKGPCAGRRRGAAVPRTSEGLRSSSATGCWSPAAAVVVAAAVTARSASAARAVPAVARPVRPGAWTCATRSFSRTSTATSSARRSALRTSPLAASASEAAGPARRAAQAMRPRRFRFPDRVAGPGSVRLLGADRVPRAARAEDSSASS